MLTNKLKVLSLFAMASLIVTGCNGDEKKKEEAVEVMETKYPESTIESVEVVKDAESEEEEKELVVVEAVNSNGDKTTTVIEPETKEIKKTNSQVKELSANVDIIIEDILGEYDTDYVASSYMENGEGVFDTSGFTLDIVVLHHLEGVDMDMMYDISDQIQAINPTLPFTMDWTSYTLREEDLKDYKEKYGEEINIDSITKDYTLLNTYKETLDLTDVIKGE